MISWLSLSVTAAPALRFTQVRLLRDIPHQSDTSTNVEVIHNTNDNDNHDYNDTGYWYEGAIWNNTPRSWIPVNDTILANLRYRSTQHPSVVGHFTWIEMVTMAKYNIRPIDQHNINEKNDFALQAWPDPPIITSISLSTVGIAGGSIVTIYAPGFNEFGSLQFYINPTQMITPSVVTSTYAVVAIPSWSGSTSWKTNLVVNQCSADWSNCLATNTAAKISYVNPTITGLVPTTWCPSGGTKLTLTGTNFGYGEIAKNFYTYISVEPYKVASPTIDYDATKTPSYRITETQIVSGNLPISQDIGTWKDVYLAWGSGPYTSLAHVGTYSGAGCV